MSLGARISEALGARPDAWLAQQLGVPLAVIGAWEEDASAPDAATIARIAGLLGVRETWLRTGKGQMVADD